MALFHSRVIKKALLLHSTSWEEHEPILKNWAKNLKEGRYNDEKTNVPTFLREIMQNVLGYKDSGAVGAFTLKYEQLAGTGPVDVKLGRFGGERQEVTAVFELKGAKTKNLDAEIAGSKLSPVEQAWKYATNEPNVKWVMVSNYREIRLYSFGKGRQYESFNLETMNRDDYERFYLLLSAPNFLNGKILKWLEDSEQQEKEITDEFYAHYKKIRSHLIDTLKLENPSIAPVNLITHAQTLLDRVIFIAFARDKGLLYKEVFDDIDETDPYNNEAQILWERFKKLFSFIDTGLQSKKRNIPAYNGGLFAHNDAINALNISDELCQTLLSIRKNKKNELYNFDNDISVSVLGHIFEQSISDLEELKADAEGLVYNKKKSKRAKDGVFYTPENITRYIIENTVGAWLQERKSDLGFDALLPLTEEEIEATHQGLFSEAVKQHKAAWIAYSQVLSQIKVLDPACGSGAFLIEVFDYLFKEGQTVNSILADFNGGKPELFRWDKQILANNIYGVDINSESVEITKLSLWLKTVKLNEPLSGLDHAIKCGNSLIDDVSVAGDKAFVWEKEFPEVMEKGGFDVVVGNPPWGAELSKIDQKWLEENYNSFEYQVNSYVLFYEQGLFLLKSDGFLGFITPTTFTYQHYFKKIREIINENEIRSLCKYTFPVFEEVEIGDTISFIMQKRKRQNSFVPVLILKNLEDGKKEHTNIHYDDLIANEGTYNLTTNQMLKNIYLGSTSLLECADIVLGIKPYQTGKGLPLQDEIIVDNKPFTFVKKQTNFDKLCFVGSNFNRYRILEFPTMWLKYGDWLAEPRFSAPFFDDQKIIIRQTADKIIAHLDETKSVNLNNVYNVGRPKLGLDLKYLLAILNSRLMVSVYQAISQEKGRLFAEVKKVYLAKLPIKVISEEQQRPFITLASLMLAKSRELQELSTSFLSLLKAEHRFEKLSKALEVWYSLSPSDFLDELKKKKIDLSPKQKREWLLDFNEERVKALALKQVIDETDREIDRLVYELYDLTLDEIAVIEA